VSVILMLREASGHHVASKVGEAVVKGHIADKLIPVFASSASSRPPFSCSIKTVHLWS
jgi:hypothetical protein